MVYIPNKIQFLFNLVSKMSWHLLVLTDTNQDKLNVAVSLEGHQRQVIYDYNFHFFNQSLTFKGNNLHIFKGVGFLIVR